jgi:hypothetical protein
LLEGRSRRSNVISVFPFDEFPPRTIAFRFGIVVIENGQLRAMSSTGFDHFRLINCG